MLDEQTTYIAGGRTKPGHVNKHYHVLLGNAILRQILQDHPNINLNVAASVGSGLVDRFMNQNKKLVDVLMKWVWYKNRHC